MNFGVTILGNNSALPAHDRHPTAQVVTAHDRLYLIDCGEGTQMQMSRYRIRRSRIRHIFISHLHGDHYFGLIGLLNSFGLQNREHPLHIYAPAPLQQILQLQFDCADTHLPFELIFVPLEAGCLLEEEDLTVSAFPTNHRIPCFGFMFRQRHRKRKVDPASAHREGIPSAFYPQLQAGKDFTASSGKVVPNARVTQPPPPDKAYAFCADTRYDESLLSHVKGVDMLYHETTYLQEHAAKAMARYHSTSVQAAELALKAGAAKLLVGHFSSTYEQLDPFLEECAGIFPHTQIALEGVTYLV